MLWLTIAISAYFILAAVFLADKYLLKSSIPGPAVYSFYVGFLSISSLFLIPFVNFYIPENWQIILALFSGAVFIYGLFWFYKALSLFEASRVVPAIGGLTPLLSFGLVYIFSLGQESFSLQEFLSFGLLILGSVFITAEEGKIIHYRSLKISALAAFFLSLSFVSAKYVYLNQSFWNGFVWMRIGGFLAAIVFFLLVPRVREEVLKKKISFKKKTMGVFILNQAVGSGANILQNWAIALAPLVYVALVSALQGIQYVFLFIFATVLSLKYPAIIREEISKKIFFQKVFSILLIVLGIIILAIK